MSCLLDIAPLINDFRRSFGLFNSTFIYSRLIKYLEKMYQRVFTAKPVAGTHAASRRSSISVRAATALPAEVNKYTNINYTA